MRMGFATGAASEEGGDDKGSDGRDCNKGSRI